MIKLAIAFLLVVGNAWMRSPMDREANRDVTIEAINACSCELLVQTVGAGVNLVCDGTCIAPADNCDFHTEWLSDGGIITTCACYVTPDAPYSCGDKDCESGFEWAPGPGAAFLPVGAVCRTVDCRAQAGCKVKPPPYAVLTNPCDC